MQGFVGKRIGLEVWENMVLDGIGKGRKLQQKRGGLYLAEEGGELT